MAEDNSVAVSGGQAPGEGAVVAAFTPQEEAFLRHYSESVLEATTDQLVRYEAMAAAGYVAGPISMAERDGVLAQAGEVLARAERLSLSQVCSSIGADKVLFCALLWKWCNAEKGNDALKALMLLGRIHGMWEKGDSKAPQVALIFNQAKPREGTEKPATLPFTLSSADYSVFSESDSENEKSNP